MPVDLWDIPLPPMPRDYHLALEEASRSQGHRFREERVIPSPIWHGTPEVIPNARNDMIRSVSASVLLECFGAPRVVTARESVEPDYDSFCHIARVEVDVSPLPDYVARAQQAAMENLRRNIRTMPPEQVEQKLTEIINLNPKRAINLED